MLQRAPVTLRPQMQAAALAIEMENLVRSDSNVSNLPQDVLEVELKAALTEGSARRFQKTLTIGAGLPTLSGLLTTRRGSVESTAPECPGHTDRGQTTQQPSRSPSQDILMLTRAQSPTRKCQVCRGNEFHFTEQTKIQLWGDRASKVTRASFPPSIPPRTSARYEPKQASH